MRSTEIWVSIYSFLKKHYHKFAILRDELCIVHRLILGLGFRKNNLFHKINLC